MPETGVPKGRCCNAAPRALSSASNTSTSRNEFSPAGFSTAANRRARFGEPAAFGGVDGGAGRVQFSEERVFTSTNTRQSPSRNTRSISPCADRKFAVKNLSPCFRRCFLAARSPSLPRRRCSGRAGPVNRSLMRRIRFTPQNNAPCRALTGAKLRRWIGQGPSLARAARCCGVP